MAALSGSPSACTGAVGKAGWLPLHPVSLELNTGLHMFGLPLPPAQVAAAHRAGGLVTARVLIASPCLIAGQVF